jgi:hypothetical protein
VKAARLFMATSIEVKSIADARKISCTRFIERATGSFPGPSRASEGQHTSARQETAALRDFNRANVG